MKKKLSSKSLAILSLVLVLLITSGVFLGLEWRKASDVGVASGQANTYTPDPSMRCRNVYLYKFEDVNKDNSSDHKFFSFLKQNGWANFTSYMTDDKISTLENVSSFFPDSEDLNLGRRDLIHLNFSYIDFSILSSPENKEYVDLLASKIKKASERGVKIVLNGEIFYSNSTYEQSFQFFKLFGIETGQNEERYRFDAQEGYQGLGGTRGFGSLFEDPKNLVLFQTIQTFTQSDAKVIYKTQRTSEPVMIEKEFSEFNHIVRLLGENAIYSHELAGDYYQDVNPNYAHEYLARTFSCKDSGEPVASCTDFEALPSNGNTPKDQLKVSKQFSSEGFRFSLKSTKANTTCPTLPQIAVKGGKLTAFQGFGTGTERRDNPHPDIAESVGNRFLTDDGVLSKSACQLNVAVQPNFRSKRVEFDILDVDYRQRTKPERFNVIAYGKNSKKLKTIKTPVLDNPSKSYHVVVETTEPIFSLKIVPIGSVSNWGVAYDNFCSVK